MKSKQVKYSSYTGSSVYIGYYVSCHFILTFIKQVQEYADEGTFCTCLIKVYWNSTKCRILFITG